jgi:serine/threonine-protein kinase RsbW
VTDVSTSSPETAGSAEAARGYEHVLLALPAATTYLSVLRTATAGLAARMDFTLDEIEDLRIAVDEASGMLLPGAPEGAELTCRFEVAPGRIAVTLSTPSVDRELPPRDTFAWTVLTALAGDVDAAVTEQGELAIRLVKHKGAT